MGAALVTCAADILREYAPLYPGLLDLDAAAAAEARIERQERGLPPIAVKAGGEERKERRKAEKEEKGGKKRRRSLFGRKAAEPDGGDVPVKEEKQPATQQLLQSLESDVRSAFPDCPSSSQ